MSGHSKWSTIKRQKGAADVVKGRVFTQAARAITIAVLEGGGVSDPDHNFRLRLAIEKARQVNVPKENIQRAIEKGKGGGAGAMEQVTYEAYGPGGAAMLIEAVTNNKQRTVALVKNLFDRAGFALASPGAVSYLFVRSGIVTVPKGSHTADSILEAALDAGASDVVETGDMFEVYTEVGKLSEVKCALLDKNIVIDNTEIIMKPIIPVSCTADELRHIDQFIENVEGLDDVHAVFTNVGN